MRIVLTSSAGSTFVLLRDTAVVEVARGLRGTRGFFSAGGALGSFGSLLFRTGFFAGCGSWRVPAAVAEAATPGGRASTLFATPRLPAALALGCAERWFTCPRRLS